MTDIIVIGAGIAGASVAARLAETRSVLVLEREERPGYHSTGRSAATFEPNYGPAPIRALTRASHSFFASPPPGFADAALMHPRQSMFLIPDHQQSAAARMLADSQGLQTLDLQDIQRLWPPVQAAYAQQALLNSSTADLDVDLLHQGFLRLFRHRGGTLVCNAEVQSIAYRNGQWQLKTVAGSFTAPILVNAAGAWGDEIARLAGVQTVGLQPKRRSVAVIPAPPDSRVMSWPMTGDVGETWYAKPQSGILLISPADATPVDPHDAYADDMALAEGIDRFQQASGYEVTRLERSWGGLRSFVPDGNPVCGYDPKAPGFFWLIGQGGYGIQSSPALSEAAAALVNESLIPGAITNEGLNPAELAPERLRR